MSAGALLEIVTLPENALVPPEAHITTQEDADALELIGGSEEEFKEAVLGVNVESRQWGAAYSNVPRLAAFLFLRGDNGEVGCGSAAGGGVVRIVQMSDVHVGSGLFRPELLSAVVQEANDLEPDLVAIVGDLTMEGYRWEFEEARGYLDGLTCENVVVGMGNHDARNVGYRHFEEFFGMREEARTVPVPEGEAKVVSLDSTKPDLDEGELGREHYGWLDSEFRGWDRGPRIVMIHHHILAVPGTGRDVNILLDSGDVMAILRELKVDMVLSGHRHVPYVWSISGVRVVHSGTVSSMRVRGTMPPSYNVIEFDEEKVEISLREPGKDKAQPLASFSRQPVTTSKFYPDFDRYVTYDKLPFLR